MSASASTRSMPGAVSGAPVQSGLLPVSFPTPQDIETTTPHTVLPLAAAAAARLRPALKVLQYTMMMVLRERSFTNAPVWAYGMSVPKIHRVGQRSLIIYCTLLHSVVRNMFACHSAFGYSHGIL